MKFLNLSLPKTICFWPISHNVCNLDVNTSTALPNIKENRIMSNKFEQLLDLIVNEENEKANELFHDIVVEKSREIYNSMIAEEETSEEEETTEEGMDSEEEETTEEAVDSEEETTESIDTYEEEGEMPFQDQGDDLESDTVDHEFGNEEEGEEEGEPATKGDIDDLATALDELKAEFEKLMAGEEAEEHEHPGIHGEPGLTGDEMDSDTEEESAMPMESGDPDDEEDEEVKTEGQKMREYIERVTATMDGGLAGARTGETVPAPKDGKSPISSGSGKPTTGANAENIATDTSTHDEDGTAPKGKVGGVLKKGADVPHAGQFMNTEKSGQKAKGMFAAAKKPASGEGHPVGAGTGQNNVTGATNTKSIESGK